ncbi:MAG: hypothetical protein HWN80_02205 [Candidatus Lokiarchaeota archaeon]|nr:hypothetical protein [Candidatus Lokiarchaeota archaeon]
MNIKNWKNNAVLSLFLGSVIYLVLMFLAMIFYAGGTRDNPLFPGYSFWGNTISDSGRFIAWSGISNTPSMVLLSLALIINGAFYIPFYLLVSNSLSEGKLETLSSKIGAIFGILFSISLIGIAFTPADILYIYHMIFVFIGYISVFLNGVFFTIAFYKNKDFSNTYALIFGIYTIFYFISILLSLIGLLIDRNLMVLFQKLGTFAALIAFLIIGYGFWKFKKS